MIAWILGYLLVGELLAVGFVVTTELYNRRFVGIVRPTWCDLGLFLVAQLIWVALVPTLVPYLVVIWRRAVAAELCVCGHSRARHQDSEYPSGEAYTPCDYQMVSSRFLVSGEGEQFVYCKCPKFTNPKVTRK